ncbi:NAD-dependent epimerase/dehydratase family protein [Frondihabitans australicus]|uniref:NAD-dependent epimerase/dehydratase family protein n=1 Tax=Frondihabitans australicus TaxID=386892 RepID=A0A495IF96_9MICO|nr:NAD(P)-dependent oxidoreductase [Frondihabitans australicus]RKR74677.1 NAD-dependent epimerase/dehydratase family protein [Frondihabitans australicus]
MQRIVITGGSSTIATAIRPRLAREGREIVLLDVVPPRDAVRSGETFAEVSVLEPAPLAEALAGADLVVHLAGHPDGLEWADILRLNVDGTQKCLEAAHSVGVQRVLLASSNHAVGYNRAQDLAGVPVPAPRPDSYYGVGKVALEALGSLFADRFGMTIVSARIGSFFDEPRAGRPLATWVSPGDIARLVEAVAVLDEPGHRIVWGMSRNFPGWFDLSEGLAIGFSPSDDSLAWAEAHGVIDSVPSGDVYEGGEMIDEGYPLHD